MHLASSHLITSHLIPSDHQRRNENRSTPPSTTQTSACPTVQKCKHPDTDNLPTNPHYHISNKSPHSSPKTPTYSTNLALHSKYRYTRAPLPLLPRKPQIPNPKTQFHSMKNAQKPSPHHIKIKQMTNRYLQQQHQNDITIDIQHPPST